MSKSHDGPFVALTSRNATIEGWQIAFLLTRDHLCCLQEETQRPGIAFACFARKSFARAFMVAWTDPDPGGEVRIGGKLLHRDANFSQDACGRPLSDPWQRTGDPDGLLPTPFLFCLRGHGLVVPFGSFLILASIGLARLALFGRVRRDQPTRNLCRDPFECLLHLLAVDEMLSQQKLMMRTYRPHKSRFQLLLAGLH